MADIRDMAKMMAQTAIDEGAKIGFETAAKFCERMAHEYAGLGNSAAMTAAQECANGIREMQKHAVAFVAVFGRAK